MKQDRQENECPFDQYQRVFQTVNLVDVLLEGGCSAEQAGVDRQVDDHVRAHGDQPGQRMQTTHEELVAGEERRWCTGVHRKPS